MNNKFGECCDCPALIDGRFFTRYDDRIELDLELMKKNNITDSLTFRKFLIDNGASLIDSNIKNIEKTHKCKYNKKEESPIAPINTSQYIGTQFNDPSLKLAPFDTLSNPLISNQQPITVNNDIPPSPINLPNSRVSK
ncbi:MAG: hypothetical protein EBY22_14235, partial [Gammaproteobacteria bacterium]|nr:hypothetical protein [Gammaproteobacteria bacterium]